MPSSLSFAAAPNRPWSPASTSSNSSFATHCRPRGYILAPSTNTTKSEQKRHSVRYTSRYLQEAQQRAISRSAQRLHLLRQSRLHAENEWDREESSAAAAAAAAALEAKKVAKRDSVGSPMLFPSIALKCGCSSVLKPLPSPPSGGGDKSRPWTPPPSPRSREGGASMTIPPLPNTTSRNTTFSVNSQRSGHCHQHAHVKTAKGSLAGATTTANTTTRSGSCSGSSRTPITRIIKGEWIRHSSSQTGGEGLYCLLDEGGGTVGFPQRRRRRGRKRGDEDGGGGAGGAGEAGAVGGRTMPSCTRACSPIDPTIVACILLEEEAQLQQQEEEKEWRNNERVREEEDSRTKRNTSIEVWQQNDKGRVEGFEQQSQQQRHQQVRFRYYYAEKPHPSPYRRAAAPPPPADAPVLLPRKQRKQHQQQQGRHNHFDKEEEDEDLTRELCSKQDLGEREEQEMGREERRCFSLSSTPSPSSFGSSSSVSVSSSSWKDVIPLPRENHNARREGHVIPLDVSEREQADIEGKHGVKCTHIWGEKKGREAQKMRVARRLAEEVANELVKEASEELEGILRGYAEDVFAWL